MKKLILMLMLFMPMATFAQKFGHVNAQEVMASMPEFIKARGEVEAQAKQYDNDLKAWFAYELFDMDDETSWLNEWLAAKSVTATFTGKDGSTKTYTLTKDNLQAIRDILNVYDTLLGSDVSTARVVLRSLVK